MLSYAVWAGALFWILCRQQSPIHRYLLREIREFPTVLYIRQFVVQCILYLYMLIILHTYHVISKITIPNNT